MSHAGGDETQMLAPLLVQPLRDTPVSGVESGEGRFRFDRDAIDRYGGADGSLDGVFRQIPGVQFGESALEPESASDLRPESISISGGRFYENRLLLDGLNVGSRLDPAASSATGVDALPGHEQGWFVDSDLIGEVRVFDSNAPAEYGRFTGGVVDLDTRRAGVEPEGSLFYSTTRSDWVRYHTVSGAWDPDGDTPPPAPREQPDFRRERAAFNYSAPVGETSGVVAGASIARSRTPQVTLGESRSERQENINLLGKFSTAVGERGYLDLSATYAPFRNETFLTDVRDSDFTTTGGGYGVNASLDYAGAGLDQEWKLGATYSENSRSAPNGYFNSRNTASRSWGREADVGNSREGGYGDLESHQAAMTAGWRGTTSTFRRGRLAYRHRIGVDASHQRYRFNRPDPLLRHTTAVENTDVQCRGITRDCVQGEQYFAVRQVHPADDVEVGVNEFAAFGETTFDYRRLSLTLGLRYDHDDFLDNQDIAYRSRAVLDVFGTGRTKVRAGLNRYYGAPLLTYRLREARRPYFTEQRGTSRNVVQDWSRDVGQGRIRYRFEDLSTPYSDERVLGIEQALLGGRLRAQVLQRDNRDEFAQTTTETQPDGFRYRIMNNDGRSRHREISAAWYAEYGRTAVSLSASYSETETSNANYDDPLNDTGGSEFVLLDGERLQFRDLEILRSDFARPVVANLHVAREIGSRVTAGVNVRYRGSQDVIARTGATAPGETIELDSGEVIREDLDVYRKTRRPATFLTGINLDYHQPLQGRHSLTLEAEITNLFNSRTHTVASGESGVEMGRFFWVGARYGF
ncbi:TonB-dependent receptor plug domain-containing protein [Aquisalimonas asiatica]|uniref:Outer membrane receptor proteins, mostly Fe transport n=1 Tax=Aquisalimonas asiatica TaxID=406100 RepID=A0A1H8TZH2_9GAMM|nr:TonB-dependent receptor plug domain-containing protein [Aquisalimonas asiatica]SEO96265.1 Outer membrane receptor proteins, mostly Fe transport [Aquisalimonas asiatica]